MKLSFSQHTEAPKGASAGDIRWYQATYGRNPHPARLQDLHLIRARAERAAEARKVG